MNEKQLEQAFAITRSIEEELDKGIEAEFVIDKKPLTCLVEGVHMSEDGKSVGLDYYDAKVIPKCELSKWLNRNFAYDLIEYVDVSSVIVKKYAKQFKSLKTAIPENWCQFFIKSFYNSKHKSPEKHLVYMKKDLAEELEYREGKKKEESEFVTVCGTRYRKDYARQMLEDLKKLKLEI